MKVLSARQKELSRTVALLIGYAGVAKDCQRCDFCRSIEDEDTLFLVEDGDILEDLMTHLKAEYCRVLGGAINFLRKRYKAMLLAVFNLAVMEDE